MLRIAGSGSTGNTSGMEDQPIVKRRKKDSEPVSVVPAPPPKPKMSALRRKEMRRERMEQKKQERLAKRKAEVGNHEFG